MSLGHVAFPLAPRNTAAVIAHLLESSGATHILVSGEPAMQRLAQEAGEILREKGLGVKRLPMITHEEYSPASDRQTVHKVVDVADDEVAIILHSSGTMQSAASCDTYQLC